MEQGQFWMWTTKRKYSLSSCNNFITSSSTTKPSSCSHDDSSWEEQAFAEDASGPLGGCIWPPRSYTCSFCKREFRSAQALGGHMNVHRRDRARLKQPSSPQNNNELHHQIPNTSSSSSVMGFICPYNNNTYSPVNPNSVLVASASSNMGLAPSSNIAYNSSSIVPPPQGHRVMASNYSSLYSSSNWSNLAEAEEAEKITEVLDCECDHEDNGKSDLAFSLNLVVCRGIETKEEDIISCKKRRTCETSSILPLFPNSNSSTELISPSPKEELDLELRLGQSKHKGNQDMEFSLNSKDRSERIRWDYSSEEATQVKSYTCAFCQKGFSNAQALGGHMNIHRRDRARLRQQYSLDTNPNNDLHHQNPDDDINHKRPSIFPEARVNIGISSEISSQLPIFFGVEEKMELDLELRLGPPVKQTPPILRRFF